MYTDTYEVNLKEYAIDYAMSSTCDEFLNNRPLFLG